MLGRCLINDTHFKYDTPPLHGIIIMKAGVGQVFIGKDQLLATNRIETRRFGADLIHSAAFVVQNYDKVTFNWAVSKGYNVGKQIGKDGCRRTGNSHTGDY